MEEKTAKFTILMDEQENVSEIIKRYRQYHSLTQEQLAEFIGVKHFTLRSWEQNKARPQHQIWRKYKKLLK